MQRKFTLNRKMMLGGIVAIVVPLLITGVVITLRLTDSLKEIFNEKAVFTAKNIAKIITIGLEREIDYSSAVAAENKLIDLVAQKKYSAAIARINAIYKRVKVDSLAFLIADTNGIIRADISNDSVHIDISDRSYFLQAKGGSVGIEGPFISRMDKRQMMAIAHPVYKEKKFVGVLIFALEMRHLVAMISSNRIGKTGYAFVTNKDGFAIVHPQKEIIFKENVFREEGMKNLAEKLKNRETGSEEYTFRGVKKIAGFTYMELTGWNVVFCQNRSEIMMPINAILFFLLLSGCLFLALAIMIIAILFPKISQPVQMSIDLLKELVEHSDYAILTIGLDNRIIRANPAAEIIFKRSSKELIGSEPVLENTSDTPPETIWRELKCGRMWSGNVVVRFTTSEPLTLAVMIIPVANASGTVESFLEVARDITEEQRIQLRLAQTQKMEALGTIAGGIAHDFNNILSAIFAYTEFSLMVSGNPPETQENLKALLNASERARELVSQILTFSRKTANEFRPLSPKLIVGEAIKMLRSSIPSEIELHTSLLSDAMILADPIQIHQIVVNICTNALHAIKPNKGTIDVILEDMVVDEEFAHSHPGLKPGNHVLLKIADSGKGIEPEIIDRIFEPFFTTKHVGEGTGLGLSVVHGIVKKLGGIITVYSKVGMGTAFNIIIPAISAQQQETVQSAEVCKGGTERILLLDDEKNIVEPLSNILTSLGYHVSMYTDSLQALDSFRQNPDAFDLVITDYSMPHMTGIEIVGKIRKIRSDMRIIVNSGYITREITELFARVGVHSILIKPINTYQLTDAIRKMFI